MAAEIAGRPARPLGPHDGLPDRLRDKGGVEPLPRRCNACMTRQPPRRAVVFRPSCGFLAWQPMSSVCWPPLNCCFLRLVSELPRFAPMQHRRVPLERAPEQASTQGGRQCAGL